MTPNGQDGTQYPQPLQTSGCTITVSNSVRTSAPVGQASMQPAFVQCLQTSDMNTQRSSAAPPEATASRSTSSESPGMGGGAATSTKRTWRQVVAFSSPVWS